MKITTTLLTAIFIVFCCTQLNAQNEIQEDDISISILKWYYDQYPNATTVRWGLDKNSVKSDYTVSFIFKGQNLQAIYSSQGKRLAELRPIESTPINLTNYLYEQFDQFKVKKVSKKTLFPSEKVSYIVKVKSKSEGLQEIEVDESTFDNKQFANNNP